MNTGENRHRHGFRIVTKQRDQLSIINKGLCDKACQTRYPAAVDGNSGNNINIITDKFWVEFGVNLLAVDGECPGKETSICGITKYQTGVMAQFIRRAGSSG